MKFAEKTIEDFLYIPNKFFTIPEFQRPYSWQSQNIQEYLIDLEEAITKNKGHYFGTVVFVLDNIDSSSIIDGQQRVTTSLLMITAIYHLLMKHPERSTAPRITAQDIRDNYLVNRNDSQRIKLRTVTTDNMIFQRIFETEGDASQLKPAEKQSKLYQAYAEFKAYFSEKPELSRYISGLSLLEIVTIALDPRDDNPQRVFESINSTGKPLTDGDKIRNFALMLNNDSKRDNVYRRYWTKIEQALTDVNKDYITDFFRSYMIAERQAIIRTDDVYPSFKSHFQDNVSPEQTSDELNTFYGDIVRKLEYYLLLKFGIADSDANPVVIDVAFKMRYIQTDLYIPFAMSVLSYYDENKITKTQLEQTFQLIEIYFSRRIVCNITTTSVDRMLAPMHKDILKYLQVGPGADYVEIFKYLLLSRNGQTELPKPERFIAAIRTNPTYTQRNSHIHYILTAVDTFNDESETLHQMADGTLNLSIEHVMPQTLTENWLQELGADQTGIEHVRLIHSQFLHTLANLTLTAYNSEYSNRDFQDKKTLVVKGQEVGFNQSPLYINKWIKEHDHWNESTLKERQDWWIAELTKVWPMPTTTYAYSDPDQTIVNVLRETDLRGMGVRSITVFGTKTVVSLWTEALDTIAEILNDTYPTFFEKVAEHDILSKYIKTDNTGFGQSVEIAETGYFINTNNDTNTKLRIIRAFGDVCELSDEDIKAELITYSTGDDTQE